jgi:4-amino-4-deoxychorismate lyase
MSDVHFLSQLPHVSPLDRGLHYGDGLFETMCVQRGRVRLLARHLARLRQGARRLAIPLPGLNELGLDDLQAALVSAAAKLGEGVLKLIVTRGCGGRGYALPQPTQPSLLLLPYPATCPPAMALEAAGIRVRLCDLRLARQPRLAGIKHLNRLEYVLARAEWQNETIAEGLLLDSEGELVEAVTSNIFLVRDGRLLTPILDQCGVAGVMRDEVMDCARVCGLEVVEARLGLPDLLAADEVFLSNSLHGIRPVMDLVLSAQDVRHFALGAVTRRLHQALDQVLHRSLGLVS